MDEEALEQLEDERAQEHQDMFTLLDRRYHQQSEYRFLKEHYPELEPLVSKLSGLWLDQIRHHQYVDHITDRYLKHSEPLIRELVECLYYGPESGYNTGHVDEIIVKLKRKHRPVRSFGNISDEKVNRIIQSESEDLKRSLDAMDDLLLKMD